MILQRYLQSIRQKGDTIMPRKKDPNREVRTEKVECKIKGKSFKDMTPEEIHECAVIGGLNAGVVRREKQSFNSVLMSLIDIPLKSGKSTTIDEIKNLAELKGKNLTSRQALAVQLIQDALKGKLDALKVIIELLGEKPSDKVEVKGQIEQTNPYNGLTEEELRKLAGGEDD